MSKISTQIRHLMRSPKALVKFHSTGKLPNAVSPSSPLITYLESLSPRDRIKITNVRLSPKLGYQSNAQFASAQAMLNYLKPNAWIVGSWPAESCRIKGFTARITDELFNEVQSAYRTKR